MKNKISKLLGIFLTLLIIFSCCSVAFTATASTEITYYIASSADGGSSNNDGLSAEKPLLSVVEVIEKANELNLTTDDTISIKVVGTTDKADWGVDIPCDAGTIKVESNDIANISTLNTPSTFARTVFDGTVEFDNLVLHGYVSSGNPNRLVTNGRNIVYGENVTMGDTKYCLYPVFQGQTVDRSLTYVLKNKFAGQISLTHWNSNGITYKEDLTYIIDNAVAKPEFVPKSGYDNSSPNRIMGNLNIAIYDAAKVTFAVRSSKPTSHYIIDGAIQIITPEDTNADITNLVGICEDNVTPAGGIYHIINSTGIPHAVELTDTAGKYKVNIPNPEHKLIFENTNTNEKIYYDQSGYITLPAGIYKAIIERDPISIDYYVDPDGIEVPEGIRPADAGTKNNPVKTFADATRLISQDGLVGIDTATIRLKEGVTNYWKNENTDDVTYNVDPSNYSCRVVIDSYSGEATAELYSYNSFHLSGNLIIRNVNFTVGNKYASPSLQDYNFTLEETATLTCPYLFTWKTEFAKPHVKDQTVIIDGVLSTSFIALSAPNHNHVSTGDFNFYFNNPDSSASFRFGPYTGASSPNIYNGNINIVVKQAKTLSFEVSTFVYPADTPKQVGAQFNGSIQILVDDDVKFPYSVKTNFENLDVAGGKWYITNAATDDDFVAFSSKGKLSVKNGAKAYSRQYEADQVIHTGGEIDFSAAPGAYTVSDKEIAPLPDESQKMLYFYTGSTSHFLGTRANVTAGETYQFEYTIYNTAYSDSEPMIRDDGDRKKTCDVEIIDEIKIGDYYKVICRATIPDDYSYTKAFFGVQLTSYSEGLILDRTIYNVNDPSKKDLFELNQKFLDGLDGVSLDYLFWGKVFTDHRGGNGLVRWQNGLDQLEVMTYDLSKIDEIKRLNNPDDGEWWNSNDIKKEDNTILGEGSIIGTFKYRDGTPIPNKKILLVNDEFSRTVITNSQGIFKFVNVPVGYYSIFLVDGTSKIDTGFSSYLSDGDIIKFDLINDVIDSSYEEEIENEEYVASGKLQGTVYTPQLETVANLKLVLKGIGEVVTDKDGKFGFGNIPVGTYELYAINEDGSEYLFREVDIEDGATRTVKLKYEPPINTNGSNFNTTLIIIIIAASVIALLGVGVIIFFLFKKKKAKGIV